jgi:carboxyl-terminal processing protease
MDEVEIKSVPFFCKIDDKTGYIVLSHFNKASFGNQRSTRTTKKKVQNALF